MLRTQQTYTRREFKAVLRSRHRQSRYGGASGMNRPDFPRRLNLADCAYEENRPDSGRGRHDPVLIRKTTRRAAA
jgi:hypothetical protein